MAPPRRCFGLRFEIDGSRRRNQDTWTDAAGTPLEDQLGALMTRIEEHAAEQVNRQAEELRQLQEQRRRWDAAKVTAHRDYIEDHLRATIADRVEAGHEARDMRAYSEAIADHAAELSARDRRRALEWAAWIRGYAEEIDPVRTAAGLPVVPEPTDRDLRPYLKRAGHSGWRP